MHNAPPPSFNSPAHFIEYISKHPYTQTIGGIRYTYSYLKKKGKTISSLTNQRLVMIKGIESISYARDMPQVVEFGSQTAMPKAKTTFKLSDIQEFTADQNQLIIKFEEDIWEFECQTQSCAQSWQWHITKAQKEEEEFNKSKYQKYSDYVASKILAMTKSELLPKTGVSAILGLAQKEKPEQRLTKSEMPVVKEEQRESESVSQSSSKPNLQITTNEAVRISMVQVGQRSSEPNLNRSNAEQGNEQIAEKQLFSALVEKPSQLESPVLQKSDSQTPSPIERVKQQGSVETKGIRNKPELTLDDAIDVKATPDKNLDKLFQGQTPLSSVRQDSMHIFDDKELTRSGVMNDLLIANPNFKTPDITKGTYVQSQVFYKAEDSVHIKPQESEVREIILKPQEQSKVKAELRACRRNWLYEWVKGEQESQLILDYQQYITKLVEVLIAELSMPQEKKEFPAKEITRQHATFEVDGNFIEFFFYNEEQIQSKHRLHSQASNEFKNWDYLLDCTENEGNLLVPLAVMFESRGIVGRARTLITADCESNHSHPNFMEEIDHQSFEKQTRCMTSSLTNSSSCQVVQYHNSAILNDLSSDTDTVYFADKLQRLIPISKHDDSLRIDYQLRPQLVTDDLFEDQLFRVQPNVVEMNEISRVLDNNVNKLVESLQLHKKVFTNSVQLTQLLHDMGLNVRQLGVVTNRVKQSWLKNILRSELAARCLKRLFRFDIQNCLLTYSNADGKSESPLQLQKARAVSFLNIVLGNTESTFRIWRTLNAVSQNKFKTVIWKEHFGDINIGYFLQALQHHLKITLSSKVTERPCFKSMNSLKSQDFVQFKTHVKIYSLDFTQQFQEIRECLEDMSKPSFERLCKLLSDRAGSEASYLQIVKSHPIYHQINQFLLNFISPADNRELFSASPHSLPSQIIYNTKMTEIKWSLKEGKHTQVTALMKFIESHVYRWLGGQHPVVMALYRMLAQQYSEIPSLYPEAVRYARVSLQLQQSMLGGDAESLWKDHFLIGKIEYGHESYEQALKRLQTARRLLSFEKLKTLEVYAELCTTLSQCYHRLNLNKEAIATAKQLFTKLRLQNNQANLSLLLQAAKLLKSLLEYQGDHEGYFTFARKDLSPIFTSLIMSPQLYQEAVRMIAFPYLKNVVLRSSPSKSKILHLLQEVWAMPQPAAVCLSFLSFKTQSHRFPSGYLDMLKRIDGVVNHIYANNMLERWRSFMQMSKQTLLHHIEDSQADEGFQFVAYLSAIIGVGGDAMVKEVLLGV